MTDPGVVLMTIQIPGDKPGILQAAKSLGVPETAIDKAFGVVPVDPSRHLYAVQVRAGNVPGTTESDGPFRGPFSNPKIAPFGPTKN